MQTQPPPPETINGADAQKQKHKTYREVGPTWHYILRIMKAVVLSGSRVSPHFTCIWVRRKHGQPERATFDGESLCYIQLHLRHRETEILPCLVAVHAKYTERGYTHTCTIRYCMSCNIAVATFFIEIKHNRRK